MWWNSTFSWLSKGIKFSVWWLARNKLFGRLQPPNSLFLSWLLEEWKNLSEGRRRSHKLTHLCSDKVYHWLIAILGGRFISGLGVDFNVPQRKEPLSTLYRRKIFSRRVMSFTTASKAVLNSGAFATVDTELAHPCSRRWVLIFLISVEIFSGSSVFLNSKHR